MPTYRYPSPSLVEAALFKKTEGGQRLAYLQAREGARPEQLEQVIEALVAAGMQVSPTNMLGKPALEVRGFRKETDISGLLEQHGFSTGTAQVIAESEQKLKFLDKVKKRSLGASGAAYAVGDVCFSMYGYKGRELFNLMGGILYGAGTGSLLWFGRKDQSDLQIRDITKKLSEYMKEHGADLAQSASIDSIVRDRKQGIIKNADDFFRRYPSEMMNVFFAAAGACIAVAAHKSIKKVRAEMKVGAALSEEVKEVLHRNLPGLQHKAMTTGASLTHLKDEFVHEIHKKHLQEGWLDIGLGGMTTISGLFAMSVKEKAHDPDAPKKEGISAVWQKIQEKPLAVAGIGYMVSTMCHAASTGIAWKYASNERRSTVHWRAGFVGFNIIAEILLAISSKGHGEGVVSDKSVDHTVLSVAAEQIIKQPKRMQEGLVQYIAGFLGRPEVLAVKNEEAAQLLRTEVEKMRKNPWALATPARTAMVNERTFADKHGFPDEEIMRSVSWVKKFEAPQATQTQL